MKSSLFCTEQSIVLASASPRRQQFLQDLGLDFTICTADIDETPHAGESAPDFAKRMALEKAREATKHVDRHAWVIGADTVVVLNDEILGKPRDDRDALHMLTRLSGKQHKVVSGCALLCKHQEIVETLLAETIVIFHDFSEEILKSYIRTGEVRDKAGAYAIQGIGSFLVKEIHGSCTNVIGLPVNKLVQMLLANRVIRPV